jgi:hypothetical protein
MKTMGEVRFDKALQAWGSPEFKVVFKQEIESMSVGQLPLQQGLTTGSYALANPFTVLINGVSESGNLIHITAGIFYQSVIAGCGCADDPTPINENIEYCEVLLDIDKLTAETVIVLKQD